VLQSASTTPEAVAALSALSGQAVLLEEVGELSPRAQDTLVRVLAGSRGALRFISTTSRSLTDLAARQVLRSDLLYRLDVVRLDIPPLRQRPEDILFLGSHFLALAARYFRRDVRGLSTEAQTSLLHHPWMGNVRELRNCMLESVLYCPHVCLRADDLRLREEISDTNPDLDLTAALPRLHAAHPTDLYDRAQRLVLQWALTTCDGNRRRAAILLGIGRGALRAKLRRYGLDTPQPSPAPPY
jgi:DNA-binding NtrC family response regulator